jgi:two-component system cell cycle sensor histidine kinase/response regulator CckA
MSNHICLVVDDEEFIRRVLRKVLEKEQIRCVEAESASEALQIINQLEGQLNLVLTDIVMPGEMDGIDLANSISLSFPELPIILISGHVELERVKHAASIFTLIQKPFGIETIVQAIRHSMRLE